MTHELIAQKRDAHTRSALSALRAVRQLPAVLYGPDQASVSLTLAYHPFEKMLEEAGESTLVNVKFENESVPSLIKDVQTDPRTGKFSHVDLFAVSMKKELEVQIDLEFVGESAAVTQLGGTLTKVKDALKIRCLPKDLVRSIAVPVEKLATFDDVITVGDLIIPTGITVEVDADEVIVKVSAPLTEEQLKAMEEENKADVSKIEVVGKKEAEAAEGEAAKEEPAKE